MPTTNSRRFSSMSVADLLEARDAYHVHLARLPNVFATAIGRYRALRDVKKPRTFEPGRRGPRKTLANTSVHPWSWPCVLVFVKAWVEPDELRYGEAVPPVLYLPDGRMAPTCVVQVEEAKPAPQPVRAIEFPSGLAGGSYPILSDVQGEERVGSVACLVSDGDRVFALTNGHVAGPRGRQAFVISGGKRRLVGRSEGKDIGRKVLRDLYPGWPIRPDARVNLDAGLIEIDELSAWTSQVYGVGQIGELVDLHAATLTLDLIGQKVRGYGAVSGNLEGEILALFYRYLTTGGADDHAELLIGPRAGKDSVPTHHGDSGTLWFLEEPEAVPRGGVRRGVRYRPIAMQWGGSDLGEEGGGSRRMAMATALSSVCRSLDVEVVRDWRIGLSEYWGKVGHYKIGALACELVQDAVVKRLMMANQFSIGCSDEAIEAGDMPKANQQAFVALADVPDLVFRATRKMDEANHFADMDQPGDGEFAGKTLLDLWAAGKREPAVWTAFYDAVGVDEDKHRGALPFRVWQIYQDLVRFAGAAQLAEFVCAAGILAHYVGDASQPLHVSHLHHGSEASESGVHSAYETTMLDRNAAELMAKVAAAEPKVKRSPTFKGGASAAEAVVALMRRALALLPPEEIIQVYNEVRGRGQAANMWSQLGDRTATLLVDGAATLAAIWESAWKEGQHGAPAKNVRLDVPMATLVKLYRDRSFIESVWLKDMQRVGDRLELPGAEPPEEGGEVPGAAEPRPTRRGAARPRRTTRPHA